MLTHHVVLETPSVKKSTYLIGALLLTAEASLGNACGADCGAVAVFGKEEVFF